MTDNMSIREIRYVKRISQLVNQLRERTRQYNTAQRQLKYANAKVITQRRALAEMNIMAKSRNEEIERLRRELAESRTKTADVEAELDETVDTTTPPTYGEEGSSDNDAQS